MRRTTWANARRSLWAYVFVAPMLILFLGFTLYPLVASVQYTLYSWDGIGVPKDFVGLRHFADIARDPFFWNAFGNTFFYTLIVVPIQLLLALGLAVILNMEWLRARSALRYVFISPIVTSSAVVGIVFSLIYATVGQKVNSLLIEIGVSDRPIDWLGNPHTAMWLIILVGIWIGLGYPLIYFLAALQSIDRDLYDAAKVDGANGLARFWHITLPLVRPVGFVVLLIATLHSLRVFDIVQVMTQGGPFFATDVVGTYIYRQAFRITPSGDSDARLGYASAAAFFMGLLVMGISAIQIFAVRYTVQQRRRGRNR
jgi:ABC-type sugar transport system permease subunit